MAKSKRTAERGNKRWRTRLSLVQAARALLREGTVPSVADAARRAGISRSSAYQYFPRQDLLLLRARYAEAEPTSEALKELVDAAKHEGDPAAPVALLTRLHNQKSLAHEEDALAVQNFFLGHGRASQDRFGITADLELSGITGVWSLAEIEQAVSGLREQLDQPAFRKLVAALTLVYGVGAVFRLKDECNLPPDEVVAVTEWAARTLVEGALRQAGEQAPDACRPTAEQTNGRRP